MAYAPAPVYKEKAPEPIKADTDILDINNKQHAEIIKRLKQHVKFEFKDKYDDKIIDYMNALEASARNPMRGLNGFILPGRMKTKTPDDMVAEGRDEFGKLMEGTFKKYNLKQDHVGDDILPKNKRSGNDLYWEIIKEIHKDAKQRQAKQKGQGMGAAEEIGRELQTKILASADVRAVSSPAIPVGTQSNLQR